MDGDALSAIRVAGSGPANGTLALNAYGSFTDTPNAGFTGTDSFRYTANDGATNSNVATVTLTVRAVGDVPTVQFDSMAKKLTIRGSSKDDQIDVTRSLNGEIRVKIGNLQFGPYLDSRVDSVCVYELQGNDKIKVGPVVADVIAYGGRNGSLVLVRGTTVLDDRTKDTLEGGVKRDWMFKFDKDQIKTGISRPASNWQDGETGSISQLVNWRQ